MSCASTTLRCCGAEAERTEGGTPQQVLRPEEALREGSQRQTAYDPSALSQRRHEHKDACNRDFVDGLRRVFGGALHGYAAVLDDLNGESPPQPRTSKALVDGGVPASRILVPNREASVVQALQEFGASSVEKHFSWASQEDFRKHNVSAAYLDACSGDTRELQRMVDSMRVGNKEGHLRASGARELRSLVLAYTLVLRCFAEGGASSR
jgi:hypothetical protein